MLASHDGGDDAAIEHADGLYERACWSVAETLTGGPRSVPGGLCPALDGLRARGFSGRYPDPLARASLVLARHPYLGHWRDHLRGRGDVPVQPAQGTLPQAVPQSVWLLRALLPQRGRSGLAAGAALWGALPGELLGPDAGDVRSGSEQPGVDGLADRGDGGGEDLSWRAAPEPGDRNRLAGPFSPVVFSSRLAAQWRWSVNYQGSEGKRMTKKLRLMCVLAHPDDESLGNGGVLYSFL